MAVCPNCESAADDVLDPCPLGDGYYCVDEKEYASHRGDPLLGRKLADRFIVLAVLGDGSMARVYKAHQANVDRAVALKVFSVESLRSAADGAYDQAMSRNTAQDRFLQEARVLARLSHPNCVTVFDFGVADDGEILFIAMEYIPGFSLRSAINRGLKYGAILEIAQQVLLALREAHGMDIVHRDLKPENIILSFRYSSEEQVVKVVDFGIAKMLSDEFHQQTAAGALFGTPAYMSPEQCRGDVDVVGPHSDIYSLGCILYEMTCGRMPYEAKVPQEMVRMHIEDPPPELKPRPGLSVPDRFADFVRRCMRKDPAERFADAGEGLVAVSALIEGGPDGEGVKGVVSTADIMRKKASQSSGQLGIRRVSVPGDRLTGETFDPPTAASPPADRSREGVEVDIEEEASEFASDAEGLPPTIGDTHRGDGANGLGDRRRQRRSMTTVMVVFGVLAVLGFCMLLFYYIYLTVSG